MHENTHLFSILFLLGNFTMFDLLLKQMLPPDFDMNKEIDNLRGLAVKISNAAAQLQRIESKLDLLLIQSTPKDESGTPHGERTNTDTESAE